MFTLDEKVVLVTGGSKGIGAAICRLFSEQGADVAFTYKRSRKEAIEVGYDVAENGSRGLMIYADVTRSGDIQKAVRAAYKEFGRIDILVNNAGIWKEGAIGSMTEKQWDETMDANLKSMFLFTNTVVPIMKKQGYGKIINIASTAGQRGEAFHSHYAASKAGMIGFTKSIATELAPSNIICNCVAPGWVDTDMSKDPIRVPSKRKKILALIPNGRIATPEDIANAALFLASDASNHLIGSTISSNGGSVLI